MDEAHIDSTKTAVERVALAGAKVILTGSLMVGLLLPEYEGFLHPSEDAFHPLGETVIALIHAENGAMAGVPPREHDGLHDHREGQPTVVKLTSPIIVTGAGLSDQPDLWLNRA